MESLLVDPLLSLSLKKITFWMLRWELTISIWFLASILSPFLEIGHFLTLRWELPDFLLRSGWMESLLVDPLLSFSLKKVTFWTLRWKLTIFIWFLLPSGWMESLLMDPLLFLSLKKVTFLTLRWALTIIIWFLASIWLDETPSSASPPLPFLEKDHFLNTKMRVYRLHLISCFHLVGWNPF